MFVSMKLARPSQFWCIFLKLNCLIFFSCLWGYFHCLCPALACFTSDNCLNFHGLMHFITPLWRLILPEKRVDCGKGHIIIPFYCVVCAVFCGDASMHTKVFHSPMTWCYSQVCLCNFLPACLPTQKARHCSYFLICKMSNPIVSCRMIPNVFSIKGDERLSVDSK